MTRVLVVDDKEENVYYLRALLTAHGCEVTSALNGVEALVKARISPPDVVISDLLMPEMDGYTLLRHWKSEERLRDVPFIVYTATYTEPEDEALALKLGADAFILKPSEPDAFLERLREVQTRGRTATPSSPHRPLGDEKVLLREYSATLIRKLEEKTQQLEETNRSLERDIAARELAEAALRDSEAKFRVLTEVMPQLVWITGGDGRHLYFNQRWLDYTGLTAAESEREGWSWPFHADDRALADAAWAAAIESGEPYSVEARLHKADGSYHWWLIRGLPLRDASGTVLKWFGTCTDIDELKAAFSARDEAEKQASQRAALLDALFESVPDVVTHVGLDAAIHLVNRASSARAREEAVGTSWLASGPPEQREAMKRVFDAVIATGKPSSFESTSGPPTGETARVFWNTVGPVVRDGKITGAVVVARDITERKQTEAQLIVSDRMASVGTLAAGVAHEINNPLASVTANLALASEELETLARQYPVPAGLRDELRDARDGAERVRIIVRDLKIFSRGDEEKRGPVDLEQVLESTLRMAWNELRHRARVTRAYGHVLPVMANESRLGQVLLNLIINAAQAIPEGDYARNEVSVETRMDGGDRVVIVVTDTGSGIAPEIQRRLFTPFVTTKPVGVGTGLGLSICHRLVTAMGGTIDFTSELGKGTSFRVSLPVADLSAAATPAPLRAAVASRRRGRVLVVDDDAMMVHSVPRVLSLEHDVEVASGAREAMALFHAGERFDIVLCDLMMPQVTGMDLYAALTELDPQQAARVVFMTGGAFTTAARAFLDGVPNERLEKPFDIKALRALVNRYVR